MNVKDITNTLFNLLKVLKDYLKTLYQCFNTETGVTGGSAMVTQV